MTETKVGISSQTLVSNANRAAKLPQYIAALAATLGGFCFGTTLGWSSPVFLMSDPFGFEVTDEMKSWIGATVAIGAMIGSAAVGGMIDVLGRKKSIMLLAGPTFIGWMFVLFGKNVWELCLGRLISGFSTGGYSVVVPLYVSELAEVEVRGTLGSYFQLQLTIGILMTYIIGSFASVFWITASCAICPVVLVIAMMFMPESPIFYLKKSRMEEARSALQFFRGRNYDVETELLEKKQELDKMEAERVPFSQAFSTTPAKRGLVIGLGVMFFQQLSGVNAVIFYANNIFKDAGSKLDANISSIIVGGVMVFMTWVATLVVDKAGRKPLLLLSASIMAVSTGALGVYFYLKENNPDVAQSIGLLPVGSLSLFIIVFSLGFGPIPWMFISEIFPPQIKGAACSIACLFNWACVFCVTKFFGNLNELVNSYGTFWIFAGISVAGTIFVITLVPETKGKTLEEIQKRLGASSRSSDFSMENGNKT